MSAAAPPRRLFPALASVLAAPSAWALLFAAYAGTAILFLALAMPPWQNPDEPNHFARAEQVSRLGFLVATPPPGQYAGGWIDPAIRQSQAAYETIKFHREAKVTRAMAAAAALHWGAAPSFTGFSNTAVYPALGYLPASAAILAGKTLGLSVPATLILARIASGIAAIAIATAAIRLAGATAPLLFTVVLLPMALAQMASPSQDSLMFAAAALAGALIAAALRTGSTSPRRLALLAACLGFLAAARPPYLPLAAIPLFLPGALKPRAAACAAILALALGWSALALATAGIAPFPGTDPAAQALRLLHHPWLIARVAAATLQTWGGMFAHSFIGQLGWLDVDLPPAYHALAWAGLGLAFFLAARASRTPLPTIRPRLALLAILALSVAAIALLMYLTWTPLGAPVIQGIQGRYFLPLALLAPALAVTSGLPRAPGHALHGQAHLALAALPAISIAVTAHAIIQRYYLG